MIKYGLRARKIAKKPSITGPNRQKRKKWAKKMLVEKNADFWKTVNSRFSDETMLELNSKGKDLVRRPRKTRLDSRFFEKNSFFSRKKLMVLGCIRSNGDRLLIPIKNKVDSDEYTKILQDHVIDFLYMHELFQQDNAPAHTSIKNQKFFRGKWVHFTRKLACTVP